jgi:hypothetical protein
MLYIIHRPVFYLKHDVSETGFFFHLQMEFTQIGPKERPSLCLRMFECSETVSVSECSENVRMFRDRDYVFLLGLSE